MKLNRTRRISWQLRKPDLYDNLRGLYAIGTRSDEGADFAILRNVTPNLLLRWLQRDSAETMNKEEPLGHWGEELEDLGISPTGSDGGSIKRRTDVAQLHELPPSLQRLKTRRLTAPPDVSKEEVSDVPQSPRSQEGSKSLVVLSSNPRHSIRKRPLSSLVRPVAVNSMGSRNLHPAALSRAESLVPPEVVDRQLRLDIDLEPPQHALVAHSQAEKTHLGDITQTTQTSSHHIDASASDPGHHDEGSQPSIDNAAKPENPKKSKDISPCSMGTPSASSPVSRLRSAPAGRHATRPTKNRAALSMLKELLASFLPNTSGEPEDVTADSEKLQKPAIRNKIGRPKSGCRPLPPGTIEIQESGIKEIGIQCEIAAMFDRCTGTDTPPPEVPATLCSSSKNADLMSFADQLRLQLLKWPLVFSLKGATKQLMKAMQISEAQQRRQLAQKHVCRRCGWAVEPVNSHALCTRCLQAVTELMTQSDFQGTERGARFLEQCKTLERWPGTVGWDTTTRWPLVLLWPMDMMVEGLKSQSWLVAFPGSNAQ
eukprot:Gregarina_sp_Poly_1__1939@NODE_1507_length_3975_cov_121_789150_g999_i0_p1_GENE_NODE_1507_length_3975_cov_121_789150_g999_i0NODE_1507_length_3975_cov_121_789150_g999_i0_p1_ORF_typecomplete_len541_score84_72HypA/PF01155_19/0_16FYVE/PF01363_21/0_44_NODE_1507_length_3975_cov_121_789150_g999_i016243246